ncbi:MAG: hypothetical protein GWP06_11040 [Actinobacteria bacterium]|nr:hypothetical protein [Actinomycetota bacterium]
MSREEMIDRLKMHLGKAAELVQETGYYRRDPEVELGYAGLFFAQGGSHQSTGASGSWEKIVR